MKKLLTYEDFINCSMNEIEENIINHPEQYTYDETTIVYNIFIQLRDKFKNYELIINKLNKKSIYNKTEKIKDLILKYEELIRDI